MASQQQDRTELVESIINYTMLHPERAYLWEALQVAGSGVFNVGGRQIEVGNQKLAVLGDTIMAAAMAEYWFQHGGTKGEWNIRRSSVLSNQNLARVARESGLVSCMNTNALNPVAPSTNLSATLVEAVIGAVYHDSGLVAAKEVMRNLSITDLV